MTTRLGWFSGPTKTPPLLVVRPEHGNAFYNDLARRIWTAIAEFFPQARLVRAADLQDDLEQTSLILVNPVECSLSGKDFVARASRARARVAAVAECVETPWYRAQFAIDGLNLDAVFDIGFEWQGDRHEAEAAYHFVFNGLSAGERFARSPQHARPIPWAVVGHATAARAQLVAELVGQLASDGFVFMPPLGPPSAPNRLRASSLDTVLRRSRLYVWRSHHRFRYYESFRFRNGILCGALPCKIDELLGDGTDTPGVFPTLAHLRRDLEEKGVDAMLDAAISFYVERGPFSQHLKHAIARVVH